MIEKVTYILGAGFSAPAGLPVMGNFLLRSKDLYFQDPNRYRHFENVFKTIQELSVTKNYYDSDLFNIEEILSIIEMQAFLEGRKLKKAIIDYIIDVVEHYTPVFKPYTSDLPSNWYRFMFGGNIIAEIYGCFAATLLGLKFEEKNEQPRKLLASKLDDRKICYSLISLNYDILLENCTKFINENYKSESKFGFNTDFEVEDWSIPPLLKLHGSTDSRIIVPPTWAKGNQPKIKITWKKAYQVLEQTNHIRFLGYSLPDSDSYVTYLLKSAVVNSPHLKSIDVICLDNSGNVQKRYDKFILYNNYRFKNGDIIDYLSPLRESYIKESVERRMNSPKIFDRLEKMHENFMTQI